MNYTYFYKDVFYCTKDLESLEEYDCMIAMFVNSDRVIVPTTRIKSKQYVWIIMEQEKKLALEKLPSNISPFFVKQYEDFESILNVLKNSNILESNICIDATGFRTPYLLFLMRVLTVSLKCRKTVDVIYTEPKQYMHDENTIFSDMFYEVKQLEGMSGIHTSETDRDLLIIAAGYDHSRIIDVANNKKSAKKVLLFGFPSISPGMFQENILRAYKAENAIGTDCFKDMDSNIYAPAYDPFVTAQAIKEYIEKKEKKEKYSNIYLAPLSSKPQALGMALFFLWEKGWENNISIIYPFCHEYDSETSKGIARTWRYKCQLP
jgi:hypothetical protein